MGIDQRLAPRIVSIATLILLFTLVPIALADKGGTANGGGGNGGGAGKGGGSASGSPGTSNSTSLSLTATTVQLNPKAPSWCLTEDDYDQSVFSGSLSGSYSTSYQLCDLNTDGVTAGGIGLESEAPPKASRPPTTPSATSRPTRSRPIRLEGPCRAAPGRSRSRARSAMPTGRRQQR